MAIFRRSFSRDKGSFPRSGLSPLAATLGLFFLSACLPEEESEGDDDGDKSSASDNGDGGDASKQDPAPGSTPDGKDGAGSSDKGSGKDKPGGGSKGDADGDGIQDDADNCPNVANPKQQDADADGHGDACDECPGDPNKTKPGQCGCNEPDDDQDGDKVADCIDNCLDIYNPDQSDSNSDGKGDGCSCEMRAQKCVNGKAGKWPCKGIDLVAHLSPKEIDARSLNDIWGWVDPESNDEYAIIGGSNGTAFVRMTNPYCPEFLGFLKRMTKDSVWRDIKVYKNYAYMVSEDEGGMQIFDMTRLRGLKDSRTFKPDNELKYGNSHNVIINEETGILYVARADSCKRGLTIYDLKKDPLHPERIGCWDEKAVHDAHCVVYDGPDAEYVGQEICVLSTDYDKDVSVVSMKDPANPVTISRDGYDKSVFSHQGWLSEDHRYYFHGDELDEGEHKFRTRTHMWDMSDLDAPKHLGFHEGPNKATDHNMYIKDGLIYQANYRAGLRVLSHERVQEGKLTEVAHFDTHPSSDSDSFSSAWSNYPFFDSNFVIVSATGQGFFIVKLADDNPNSPAARLSLPQ